jgi:NTP pyrophosphatase (non-canonical NTP hydrolase)
MEKNDYEQFDALRISNENRQKEWNSGDEKLSLSYKGNELAGEVGELCNILKKIERERLGMAGSRATKEEAIEEIADVVICADLIAHELGINLFEAIKSKFNKTSEKYNLKSKFIE